MLFLAVHPPALSVFTHHCNAIVKVTTNMEIFCEYIHLIANYNVVRKMKNEKCENENEKRPRGIH